MPYWMRDNKGLLLMAVKADSANGVARVLMLDEAWRIGAGLVCMERMERGVTPTDEELAAWRQNLAAFGLEVKDAGQNH